MRAAMTGRQKYKIKFRVYQDRLKKMLWQSAQLGSKRLPGS